MSDEPLVSVLLAVHDGASYLAAAVESVLRQTVAEIEFVVVDDASTDATPDVLASVADPRLVVARNDERLGLAGSLNRGLERVRAPYVARMDSDDVAFPWWLERQLRELRTRPDLAIVGSGVVQIDPLGELGVVHLLPRGLELRWHALFSSPFLHNTVVLDRNVLEMHGLRYDPAFAESEDYELWARVLAIGNGDNVAEPLVLHRVHPARATVRRGDLQRALQRQVALRQMGVLAPEFTEEDSDLAWRVGSGQAIPKGREEDAARAFLALLARFEAGSGRERAVRSRAARSLARAGDAAGSEVRLRLLLESLQLSPTWPADVAASRVRNRLHARAAQRRAWRIGVQALRPLRVAAVFPEPTPYRAPLLDRVSDLGDVHLTVIYAAETVAARTWQVEPHHRTVFLRGLGIPGAERLLRHDYPVTPAIAGALAAARPDVVVVSGWSTFAAQAAIVWCQLRRVPYVLVVESHDEDARPTWRRAIKGTIVPRVVGAASGVLVTGTLARRSMLARGADPDNVHVFANTIDVEAFAARATELAARRPQLREALAATAHEVVVLSVGRLVPDKGMDVLVRAVAEAGNPQVLLVVAGGGPERARIEQLGRDLDVRLMLAGDQPWQRISELYAAADVFALLSRREPWGVVVNEAAASGLPLVLSRAVGAAHDLLHDQENGFLVPSDDVVAPAKAIGRLAADAALREQFAARSLEIASKWGYEPSVESFRAAVQQAAARIRD